MRTVNVKNGNSLAENDSPLVNLYFQSYSYKSNVYSPNFWSNSSFNVYSHQNFLVITQDSALEFGHVYSPNSVIFF